MKEIEDFDSSLEALARAFPDPRGAVAEKDDQHRHPQAAPQSFSPQQDARVLASAEGANVTGRIGIAYGPVFFVDAALSEHTTQFSVSRLGTAVGGHRSVEERLL